MVDARTTTLASLFQKSSVGKDQKFYLLKGLYRHTMMPANLQKSLQV